jgi:hypothetical protein
MRHALLADAAAEAGVPVEDVEAIAADYRSWCEFEHRHRCSLNEARAALTRARKAAAVLRQASHLPAVVVALGGLEGSWSPAAAIATQAAGHLGSLAERACRGIEVRAAGYASGGRRNLAHLLAPPPKVRLAQALIGLLPPGTATATTGGPLYLLVAAVNDAVTGEGERGIAHALRTAFRRAGSIASRKGPVASEYGR